MEFMQKTAYIVKSFRMKESKLIKLLRKLDRTDIKRLSDFINSPYYNKNVKYSKVFEELVKYHPDFDREVFSEEKVYMNSLGSERYNYFAMKNILSDLNELALKFIHTEYKGERMLADEIKLLEAMREKELFDEYKRKLVKVREKLEKNKSESEFYFEDKLHLMYEEISYVSIFEPNTRFELKQEELDSLINYFLVKVLKAYCSLLHEMKQNNYPFKFEMIDNISDYLKSRSFENIPVLNMYKNVLFLQMSDDPGYYKVLSRIKDKYFFTLNHGDAYMLFIYMRSFAVIHYSNTLDPKFKRETFELDKFMYDQGRLPLGKILYPDFIAAVKTAAAVEEYQWAEKFMEEMEGELMEDVKNDVLNFSNGFMEYCKGNLDSAMELFYKVNFNLFIMQIQVYIFLQRVYYEIGHYEDALNLAKTAKEYLNKEIATGEMKSNLTNFFNNSVKLIRLKFSVENKEERKFKFDKLLKNIENMKYNYFGVRSWLMKQTKALKI
jgi:hypothetical protein